MSLDPSRTVALVGRPNVGKSRLFNRLCGRRLSIVHDMPGVTRDIISAEVDEDYMLLDTGGLGMELEMTPKQISNAAEDQVEFAILAAKVILFIVDVRSGITALDEIVSENIWETIEVENTNDDLLPFLLTIPLQKLAYYSALKMGYDIDKPRNLAKSVTVE